MGVVNYWKLFAFLVICIHVQVLNSQNLSCNSDDLRALNDFTKGLESPVNAWGQNSDCCNWAGVICESSIKLGLNGSSVWDKRVVGLELGNRSLSGNLSDRLAGLNQLRYLNLSHNLFTGTLPVKLFGLQNLEVLDLSDNRFSGSITDINLPSIRYLDVSYNLLEGMLHATICTNSTRIRVLQLSANYFTGTFPAGFGNCTSLQHLSIDSNDLAGILPDDLWLLKQLNTLYMQDNSLSGSLIGVANLSNLVQIDLSQNMFSETLPDAFASLGKLEYLNAHSNFLFGSLPISLLNSPTIQFLNLRNNSFNGSLNLNWANMANLRSLDLELRFLNLARNHLDSQVPDSFKNLHALSFLSLSNTTLHNISATLEAVQHCKNLTTLVLTMNFHGEEIPDKKFQFQSLKALIIPYCRLTGSLPNWLSSSTELQFLDLSWNRLVGTIPDWFSQLTFLFYLDLSNNSLSGEIPKSLTKMPSLISRNISLEKPVDLLPIFKRIKPGKSLQYNLLVSFPPTLDLSYNMLSGQVLPEFGNLKELHVLYLQSNHLEGPIPRELSGMASLEVLDLSHNNLSGIIPASLTTLSFLSRFNVAYNNLFGTVPSGGQFPTFPCSSFEGNLGIQYLGCNHITPNSEPMESGPSGNEEEESNMTIFGPTFGVGVTAGFIVTVLICFMSGMFMPPVKQGRHRTRNRVIHNQ
ncbi:hypothetical protein MKW94_013128 [Papaver nudicaule]|uniref:Leucine-rich repeat-containing N-terminal plant-type domain-containing protein n=1 Tax=Papaver nudicaule TaxID=74823 RepID=A0AA41VVY0_PAPNU|nr:hypothetical protein [Papaver nudicaule]